MMKHLIRTVLSTTSLFALSLQMFAGDWPQWRGADRNDISSETGLLGSWPDNGPKRVWLSDEAGLGYSGFSIVEGKLFTMGLDDSYSYLYAFDALTGKKLWSTKMGSHFKNIKDAL